MTGQSKNLHWLPILYRIRFKLLLLAHKIIRLNSDNVIPDYLQWKVGLKSSARFTRSTLGLCVKCLNLAFSFMNIASQEMT